LIFSSLKEPNGFLGVVKHVIPELGLKKLK